MNIFKKIFGSEQMTEKDNNTSFSPFVFNSNQHQRYEQGNAVMGEQNHVRTVRVEKNISGCKGYKLKPGRGYIIKIYNDDLGKPNMSDKPMDLISLTNEKAIFRGFPVEAMSPFGWQEVDYRDYGLTVYYTDGEVSRCVLHMYDRNVDIEYRLKTTPSSTIMSPKNTRNDNQKIENHNSSIKKEIDNIIATFEKGDINTLQQLLFEFYSKINKRGGGIIVTFYPEKDKLCEVFLFCLRYDWMYDSDIREVWAENSFYCIADYFISAESLQDKMAAALNLFLTCQEGGDNLCTCFNNILERTSMHPIHSSIFDSEDYSNGAEYLIRQFSFFSATLISPIVKVHPEIISTSLRSRYEGAKIDFIFKNIPPQRIMAKISHIARIIESTLNQM